MRYIRSFTGAIAVVVGLLLVDCLAAEQLRTRFTVTLPQEDSELFVESQATAPTGTVRTVEIAPLEAGRIYEYTFTAKWRPNSYTVLTRNKTVRFKAGDEITVDLTKDDPNDRVQVQYVPTSDHIVKEMIELAAVNKDDVVYEPGCGDARITIAAVMAGAKKGIGIDIDPERVVESRAKVKAAGLEDKIEIRLGDALDVQDLSDATVVFLYMGDDFNRLIRPILWKQLKVGTRVVSHRFTMDDWKPTRSVTPFDNDGGISELHLWIITEDLKKRAAAQ